MDVEDLDDADALEDLEDPADREAPEDPDTREDLDSAEVPEDAGDAFELFFFAMLLTTPPGRSCQKQS